MRRISIISEPRPRTRLTVEQKQAIRNQFYAVRDQWCETAESEQIDWERLFELHCQMQLMQRQYPWIKKGVA